MAESSKWLAKRRCWRMKDICWCVHRDIKKLDRAGQGASGKFWYITHGDLSNKINFELQNNNYVTAAGSLWQKTGCIPMGGSFSAQAADLHCQWGVYMNRARFRDLGELRITDTGFIYWDTPWGALTLCQFRDNILMATAFADTPAIKIVKRVCHLLQRCWNLRVLCPCDTPCTQSRLQSSTTAMGFCMVCSTDGEPTAYTHPSSLDSAWDLKMGPPLMTPTHASQQYLRTVLTGVLCNSRQWCRTPLAQLLTVTAWGQVSIKSGYSPRALRRAMHAAIIRGLAASDHQPKFVVRFMHHISELLPLPRCCAIYRVLQWVKRHGQWAGGAYATWVLPKHLAQVGITGDWSHDYTPLHDHWVSVKQPGHVCV